MALYHCPCCPIDRTSFISNFKLILSLSLSTPPTSLRNTERERKNLSPQDHNPTVQNESHSYAKLPDALEQTTHSLTKPQQLTTKLHNSQISLSLSLSLRQPKLSVPAASNFASSQLSSGRSAYVVESVQMETKRRTSTSSGGAAVVQLVEATFGQLLLLTCAWDALLANLLTASALLSFAQDPFVLSATCGQKSHGDNESEHSNSEAVDGDEDGDEEKNNDGGFGDTEEELSSEDGGAGNNPNGKSNNSKAGPGGEDGEVGEVGEDGEEEEDGNNRDDNEDDGEDDGDEDNEDDEDDEDDDEGEVKDEEEIVDEEEPEDDEEEDEEEALQPPKKRKK
ncbi:uncharacterized protein LOC126603863 [Malus sylvestris]|uniref:uncharacterized protein LOC126603863 n=1 Tax=Malus sylvestris TaxID=3752 RepID=UPI0021AD3E42|nr:uncharacterized protein LOC126603863 [Malus sylvestris]